MKKCLLFVILLFSFINVYANEKVKATLVRCVDGDTALFKVSGEEVKVRFLAIDTPETVKPNTEVQAYGKDASEYTCNRLTKAKKITLEYDDKSTKTDKYQRDLAWVWVDSKLLQEELVSVGYARVRYVYGKYSYVDLLNEKQEIAKEKKLGLWSDIKYFIVTFKDKDQNVEISVEEKSKVKPLDNNKSNFIGWYKDGKEFDFNTEITEDITLEAKYESNYYMYLIIGAMIIIYVIKKEKGNGHK